MAKIRYRDWSPTLETQERILVIDRFLNEYKGRVTVRQLYYRLVAGGHIANNDKEYGRVQDLITKARYAGLIDWNAIEDRNREPLKAAEWQDGAHLLRSAVEDFRLNRWEMQPFYLELWVEKAALAGVLSPIAIDYHLTLMVNRGYGSASSMKESADRIRARSRASGKWTSHHRPIILYIGDFDPSGEDMVRDVRERLLEFGCPRELDVFKLALTKAQIEKYNPPPNPAKVTDSRAAKYIAEHGDESWEVDAIPPKELALLVRTSINAYVDKQAMTDAITREEIIKKRIRALAATFKEG